MTLFSVAPSILASILLTYVDGKGLAYLDSATCNKSGRESLLKILTHLRVASGQLNSNRIQKSFA